MSTAEPLSRVTCWEVAYGGGPYAGVAWLEIREGVLSLRPTRWVGRGSGAPLPPVSQGPIVHQGNTVDVFHARWLRNGSVHVKEAARTYVATLSSWRPIEREIIPALVEIGLKVVVHGTRIGDGKELATARFFPGLAKRPPQSGE